MEQVTNLIPTFGSWIINLLIAVAIFLIGRMIARWVGNMVARLLGRTSLDERVASAMGADSGDGMDLEKGIGTFVYYVLMLFVLMILLDYLGLQSVLDPVKEMLGRFFNAVPKIINGALILGVTYLIARVASNIVRNLLSAVGADRLSERVGMSNPSVSSLAGSIVFALILIPGIVQSLGAMEMQEIAAPASQMLDTFLGAIPSIFGAGLLLYIAYFVGRLLSSIVASALTSIGFDRVPSAIGLNYRGERSPSQLVGTITMVGLMLIAVNAAVDMLNFGSLTEIVSTLISFGGNILFGSVILVMGLWLANLAATTIQSGAGKNAGMIATIARSAVLLLFGAMALGRMGLADDIVNLAFSSIVMALAVAGAIAFGLGGRDWAKKQLERFDDQLN